MEIFQGPMMSKGKISYAILCQTSPPPKPPARLCAATPFGSSSQAAAGQSNGESTRVYSHLQQRPSAHRPWRPARQQSLRRHGSLPRSPVSTTAGQPVHREQTDAASTGAGNEEEEKGEEVSRLIHLLLLGENYLCPRPLLLPCKQERAKRDQAETANAHIIHVHPSPKHRRNTHRLGSDTDRLRLASHS